MAEEGKVTVEGVPLMEWEGGETDTSKQEAAEAIANLMETGEVADVDEDDEEEVDAREDNDADAEDDEADDAAEDDDADDEEDDEGAEQPTYKVRLPGGGEEEVPLDELLRGYSRTADYTRKTQELSIQRRAVEQRAHIASQAAEAYAQRLELVHQFLGEALSPEQLSALQTEYVEIKQSQAADEYQRLEATLAEEKQMLVQAIPEWRDEKISKAEKAEMMAYAESIGYGPEDLGNIVDHRVMVVLRDAARSAKLKGGVERIREKAKGKPVLKPGARVVETPNKRKNRGKRAAMERLARTGSEKDAAAAIAFLLD